MLLAFRNGRILTDAGAESGKTLLVRDGRIEAIVGASTVVGADRTIDLNGRLLVPGFIDTQVNGGGGVLFNDNPSVESIAAIGRAHRRFGTTGFLPTLISDDLHVVERASALTRTVKASARMLVLGREVQRLRIERDRLEREVVEAVERYRPETLEPLFPRSTSPSSGAGTTTISTEPA